MDTTQAADPEKSGVEKTRLRFPVVGIGASAGGLAALQQLFEGIAADTTMAFVVVMHLSPDHESALGAILQRAGRLPVTTVTEPVHIEAGHVYVISPSQRLEMTGGELRVSKMQTLDGRRQSVDLFFRSLAQAHQERAVCIVLSGTGSDGAQGVKRIKELGGVALAQTPADAEFSSMPGAAIQTGVVDFVLPVSEMPAKLRALWQNAQRIELPRPPAGLKVEVSAGEAELLAEEALVSIKALLRERTGHDFAHYKRGTVLRRLERRMQVNALPDLPSYRRLLDAEPRETPALLQDMLISVTNFFRDPEAFRVLEAALRTAIAERTPEQPFRAWVAGCATGEEAYSVAILLRELLGPTGTAVQVFASDIDQRAVAAARTGMFSPSIATDVSPERLREFFVPEASGFRIAKSVRDTIVFSTHNALSDPPFTRLDLICCRNLLIYLDRSAQSQLLRSFHFALRPRGLLFLGSSETVDATDGLFDAEEKTHRLYRASPAAARARMLPPMATRLAMPAPPGAGSGLVEPVRPPLEVLHERIVRQYGPATVLVDADDTVLHVSQTAAHLLRLPEGAPSNKLLMLARPELRAELRAALIRAVQTGRVVEAPKVRLKINGAFRTVYITVRPATEETPKGLLLVVFDEAEESMAGDGDPPARDPVVDSLEAELLKTQDRLRNTVGESAASTEELRASNEELQTINEELRSTTEELETSREELQAVNEELTTVNGELNLRVEETSKANDDLQNLMTSADIGAVFVDRELRVKRFTPQAATLFNLLPSDIGRSLLDITHRLQYPQLADDVAVLLRELRRVEREVPGENGRWYLARALPYRTSEDRIEGAVLTFFDITALRIAEDRLRQSEQRMRLVAESMEDYAIITTDVAGRVASWSTGAERIFGFAASEANGQPLDIIFTEEDRVTREAQKEMQKALKAGRAHDDRWHMRKSGERIFCSGIVTPLVDGERMIGFAKIARDLTADEVRERQRDAALLAERANTGRLEKASAMKDEFLAVMSHELKNPLAVIQMNAQLLSRLPGLVAEPRAVRCTEAIRSAVTSQAQIINDLLDLSRGNMGKIVLDPALLKLTELIQGIVDAVGPDVAAKSQTLVARLDDVTIVADAVRVEQIVWNLVTNACKFTSDGQSIDVTLTVEGPMARLTVSDTGIGIEPQDLADLFEMFRQVDSGANRKRSGLGIGLALVRQLAELHGGRVQVESEGLGKGTRFSVWLPLAGAAIRPSALQTASGALDGMKVLLVDDERELLTAFGELLESDGAVVELALTAVAALERASAERFDVVISDIAMPEHDGYWLAERFRAEESTRDLPLVAVSGMARDVDRRRSASAGFDAHLSKPLDLELLRREIRHAIAQHPPAGE